MKPSALVAAYALMSVLLTAPALARDATKSSSAVAAPVGITPVSAKSDPSWSSLTAAEHNALRPLAKDWDRSINPQQKLKWLNLAQGFDKLKPEQQAKLHERMSLWVNMSPQQRANARQNFAQHRQLTEGLTPEQRQAQWQAYQQLSPEERKKLADRAAKPPVTGAATAAKPQAVLKKEPPPEFGTASVLQRASRTPQTPATGKRITLAPHVAQGSVLPGGSAQDSGTKPSALAPADR